MKKSLQIHVTLIVCLGILFVTACQKGTTGPQGPAGPSGNANIATTTFTMSSWSWSTPYYFMNLSVEELTSKNIDSSLVMVYFATNGSNWMALPYTQYNSPANYYMGFTSSAGSVRVTWVYDSSLSSGNDPNTYYGTIIRCKVVVIPPGLKKSRVNHQNYGEVCTAYKLTDDNAQGQNRIGGAPARNGTALDTSGN